MIFDLFAAGLDGSANTLSYAMLLMANYPDIQAKVQSEIDRVCESRVPDYSDKSSLPYTEATIQEIMRYKTLAPLSLPRLTSQEVALEGYVLPKGTIVFSHIEMMHENPDEFPEPEIFRPERFINPDGSFEFHQQVTPFGIGKRRCLGEPMARMTVFLIFTRILQKFKIRPPSGMAKLDEEMVYGANTFPKPYQVVLDIRK